jgi:hypothetical protein
MEQTAREELEGIERPKWLSAMAAVEGFKMSTSSLDIRNGNSLLLNEPLPQSIYLPVSWSENGEQELGKKNHLLSGI